MAEKKQEGHAAHTKKADNMGIRPGITRPLKVVFMGSGSGFFSSICKDVLNIPGADQGEIWAVDIDLPRLELSHQHGQIVVEVMGKSPGWTVHATANRREALPDADYIINCIEVSGTACVRHDNDIPLKYGVDQCIGDTLGPGGLMKALRTAPTILEVLKDVEELCPNAWFLNYTNPMSILCQSASLAGRAHILGLCHSVQGTSHNLADYAGVPYAEMKWQCAGINHLAWFTELSHNGTDLYPLLQEKARQMGEVYEKDPVRFDVMKHMGYFVTESSGHFSEYLPYYRKRPELIKEYCRADYLGGSGFYADGWPKWRESKQESRRKAVATREVETDRSWEYASWIIEAMETNQPFTAYCTVPNTGLIPNLPQNNVCEVATMINQTGAHPTYFGELPPQLAAICDSNLRMIELAAIACVEENPEAAIHALMLDPLTSAVCSLDEIRKMANELFEAEAEFLPESFRK